MAWAPDYVEVDDLASYLRVEDVFDDAQMALAITSASRAVDYETNRQFGRTDSTEARTYFAKPDWEWGYSYIEIDDLMITGSPEVTIDGDAVTTFVLEPVNASQKGRPWTSIRFTADSEFKPSTFSNEVIVTAPYWGWSSIPDTIKQATLFQASRFLKRRDAPFGVAGSPDLGSELRLLSRVDPDVAVALRDYRRFRSVF